MGRLSPKVTDEGRSTRRNGAGRKISVGATAEEPLFSASTRGKVGYRVVPSVCETTPPSPPSRWAGRYRRRMQGRRPVCKKNPSLATNQRGGSRAERTSLALVFFLRLSFKKPGPQEAGPGTGRCAPRGARAAHLKGTQPCTASGSGSVRTSQVPTCEGPPRTTCGIKPRLCRRPWRHPPCGGFRRRNDTQGQGHELGDGEGQPHQGEVPRLGQQPGHRQQAPPAGGRRRR